MKHLIASTLLTLVCCAANAEAENVISVLCSGVRSGSTHDLSEPATATYLFKFEKNPENKDRMEWSIQTDGGRKNFPEKISDDPLFINSSVIVSDHSVLHDWKFVNKYVAHTQDTKINRLSGDWRIEEISYQKIPNGTREITRTRTTNGKCEAAKPKF